MANFSDYLEEKMLGQTLLGSQYTPVNTIYAALFTSLNSDGSSVTEVPSGTAYGRQVIKFGQPVEYSTSNSPAVNFPAATTPWGGIVGVALYDASSSGNQLYWFSLTSVQTVGTTDVFQIPVANLTVLMSGNFTKYTAQKILGATLMGSVWTVPLTMNAALFTSVTSNGDLVTEVAAATGYARRLITYAPPATPSNGKAYNNLTVEFAQATTPWGAVTHIGLYDTISGGNLLYWTPIQTPTDIDVDNIFRIPTSMLPLTLG